MKLLLDSSALTNYCWMSCTNLTTSSLFVNLESKLKEASPGPPNSKKMDLAAVCADKE